MIILKKLELNTCYVIPRLIYLIFKTLAEPGTLYSHKCLGSQSSKTNHRIDYFS